MYGNLFCLGMCSLGLFICLFVLFWFCSRFTIYFFSIIVNTEKKSVLPTVQLSVHVFLSFSGSPLTGTLRETLPVSRTKTEVCCMFCVKETSQNGNILRSGVKSPRPQLFKHCFLLSKTIFSIKYI